MDLNTIVPDGLVCPEGKRRVEYVDKAGTGLYIEVRATSPGQGTFYWRTRDPDANNKTTHHKLGRTSEIDLETARDMVCRYIAKRTLGLNVDTRKEVRNKKTIPTLTEFMLEQYIPYKRDSGKRGWARDRDLFENHLRSDFGSQCLDEISLHAVQKHLTSHRIKGYAASTCNHPIRVLRHAMELACKWRIIDSNQLAGVSLIREDNQVNNIMTDTELERLVRVLKTDRNRMVCSVCLFLLSTGARLNEALNARWEHIDLKRRNWIVPQEFSKSRSVRSIPLNDQALSILENLDTQGKYDHVFIARGGKPFTTIHKVWDRLRNDAGLPHLRIHDLRHQYASFLINQGRTLFEVQAILGHSDPSVTQRYAHLSTKSLQDAADSAADAINDALKNKTA